jgi:hypothetical protein
VSFTLDWTKAKAMPRKLKLNSDGGDSGSKNECFMMAHMVETGGGCVGRNLASFAAKLFSCLIYFIKTFYISTFNEVFKDNASINCITVKR